MVVMEGIRVIRARRVGSLCGISGHLAGKFLVEAKKMGIVRVYKEHHNRGKKYEIVDLDMLNMMLDGIKDGTIYFSGGKLHGTGSISES